MGEAADYGSAMVALGNAMPGALIIGDDLPDADKAALLSAISSDYPGVRAIESSVLENAFLRRTDSFAQDSLDDPVLTAIITAGGG